MTMTESRTEAAAETTHAPAHAATEPSGLASWLTTGDHTRVGRLYVVTSLVLGVGTLGLGAALGFDKIDPSGAQIPLRTITQLFSLYGWAFALAVTLPLLLGLAIAIVPLQVGARSVAFPRAAALSYWGWLVGVGLMVASYASDGGPTGDKAEAVELFLAAVFVMAVALVLACVCLATTVLTLRAPGMTMPRVPLFSWASLVSAISLVVSLPVLAGLVILLYVDHRYGQVVFGGTTALSTHLDWAITAPQISLYALAGLGIVADVLPAAARTRGHLRGGLFGAIGLAGIVGIGAFYQPAFWPDVRTEAVFTIANVLVVIAPLAVLAATVSTFMGGRTRLLSPLLWGVCAAVVYVMAAGLGVVMLFTDLDLEATVFPLGQFNATLMAGLLAGIGGFVYWGPKLWGRMFPEGAAKGLAALGLLGTLALVLPDVINGWINDQPASEVNFE
ncbi:MAG TPA: cbb3-type cytochrome c oxidase subunit I, partial [Acidimicrobiales bacterium]